MTDARDPHLKEMREAERSRMSSAWGGRPKTSLDRLSTSVLY